MATGPEHYQAAELLLDMASNDELGSDAEIYHVAKAQVHATLAHAAAKAMADGDWMPSQDSAAWREAAGGKEPAAGTQGSREEELKLLAGAILATFTKGQDGYRARVGQVQIERWRATLDGAQ